MAKAPLSCTQAVREQSSAARDSAWETGSLLQLLRYLLQFARCRKRNRLIRLDVVGASAVPSAPTISRHPWLRLPSATVGDRCPLKLFIGRAFATRRVSGSRASTGRTPQ